MDAAIRETLLTPEQRAERDRIAAERERVYQDMVQERRRQIDREFGITYHQTYTTGGSSGSIPTQFISDWGADFFDPPAMREDPVPSLEERFQMAVRQASRCAEQGDNLGRIQALNAANRLRREILQFNTTTI